MKILILADPASIHTIRWANSLNDFGNEIIICGFIREIPKNYNKNILIESVTTSSIFNVRKDGSLAKIVYLKILPKIKKILNTFHPDILHSHYASSYGLIGALSNFHPFIISVWGSDVFNFPNRSLIHRKIFKYNLSKSDKILSTSNFMAKEIEKYSQKQVEVTPFGVDLNKFKPSVTRSLFKDGDIVIGTIKSLEDKYGVDILIRCFKNVKDKYPGLSLKLLIVGTGSKENKLKELVESLGINNDTIFTGFIDHKEIHEYHNMLDISLFLSNESFGVSVIEASACEKPVIVSNIGGLPEVVEDNVTGIVVEPKNIEQITQAIEKLIFNRELRIWLGKNGRERVEKLYNWENNVKVMDKIYKKEFENFRTNSGRGNGI